MWKPSRSPYWLIARAGCGRTEILTIGGAGRVSTLALFGSEEGAIEFCQWNTKGNGWWARPIGYMGLLTLLRGSSPEAGYVALDPSPEIVVEDAIDLVSLSREAFVDSLLGRGRAWFSRSSKTVRGEERMGRMGRVHELPEPVRNVLKAQTGDAVLVVDCDYRIVYWDDRMESLTGTLAEEVMGERCFQVLQGELERGIAFCADGCPLMQLAKEGRPIASHEIRINTGLAQKRWVGLSNLTVETEEGAYLVHLLRDSQNAHETLEMARCLIQLSSKGESVPARRKSDVPTLTPRQLEVLNLLSEGKSVKEMGEELYLAEATMRNHVSSLLQALGAHSQLEVVANAREKGLLTEGRIERRGAT